ncbi:MAG TPA: class I SAM-dependent methyltransferase [Acidimicrobiia bacterium]|nr:class I SAM-dependent methyltransferase [Acidimicrobiia bacterium]
MFGEVAETYDRVRPGYPAGLLDDVVRVAGPAARGPVLEVGCGTGKATVALAARGVELVALEPSEAMAAVARRRCAPYPRVRIETTAFEDWAGAAAHYRLLASAQAWHWIRPGVRLAQAERVLVADGVVALWWNRQRWRAGDPLRDALAAVYRERVPDLAARNPGFPGLVGGGAALTPVDELEASDAFGPVTRTDYPWREDYSPARYCELLRTQSDHRLLSDAELTRLLDGVTAVLEDAGGITVDYVAELSVARRR